ncbi:amidohydrolase family protein [Salinimicrobium sp. HB62]|uniref:amidohydrolase family protein n=1 Tax=Salinimicrobium sp. HB62 TaxID=3077781 RepID=UPI002D76F8DF|nr:amidohydrolase family protein [Salinimicrobium sp. HB62]
MKSSVFSLVSLFCILLGGELIFAQKSSPQVDTTRYTGPIIDMHMHTGLPHEVPAGAPSLCRPAPCEGDGKAIVDSKELMERSLEAMDHHNITQASLSGVDWQAVGQWKTAAPQRFIASPFILRPADSLLMELRERYDQKFFEGMGEIGVQLKGYAPNDRVLDPFLKLANKHNIPVLIHCAGIGPYTEHFRSAAGNPLLLEDVLKKYPDLRIFVENAGYPYAEEMIAMMYQYPQLYADVSTITWVIPRPAFYDHLEAFMRAGLGKRIMFGSDQMVWPEKIGAAVEAVQEAPFLSLAEKQDIFYNNAARFLQLHNAPEDEENSDKKLKSKNH